MTSPSGGAAVAVGDSCTQDYVLISGGSSAVLSAQCAVRSTQCSVYYLSRTRRSLVSGRDPHDRPVLRRHAAAGLHHGHRDHGLHHQAALPGHTRHIGHALYLLSSYCYRDRGRYSDFVSPWPCVAARGDIRCDGDRHGHGGGGGVHGRVLHRLQAGRLLTAEGRQGPAAGEQQGGQHQRAGRQLSAAVTPVHIVTSLDAALYQPVIIE